MMALIKDINISIKSKALGPYLFVQNVQTKVSKPYCIIPFRER